MKEISIIIPCYNCASLIVETLNSLSKQTFKCFEVICVNDGSTDNTLLVLEQYAANDDLDLRIITQENGGVSKARNRGIDEAMGKYILFLDSDDLYHPEFVEKMYDSIRKCNADVAYCRLSRSYDTVFQPLNRLSIYNHNQSEAMHNLLYRMAEIGFYCYIYRKSILSDHNLKFDEYTRHFEDREFNWKYLCHCNTAVFVDSPLYFYRVNPNSVTQKRKINWRTDGLDAVLRVEEYLRNENCDYSEQIKSYLFPRAVWSMAKNYSICKEKELFKRLTKEYNVKKCMWRTARDKNILVAFASWLYLVYPMLFYYVVGMKK